MAKKQTETAKSLPILDRDSLLLALSPKPTLKEIEEIGGAIYLKQFDAEKQLEFIDYKKTLSDSPQDSITFMVKFLAAVITDANGTPLFSENDIDLLRHSTMNALNELFTEALAINGMGAKSEEEIEGNSEPEQA